MNQMHLFIGVLFVVVGILTYMFRNTPNPYIGVRLGYTYFSKEAWNRANTFAALYCVLLGVVLLFLAFMQLPDNVFILLMLVGIAPMVIVTYRIAKETYEREDLKMPINGEPKLVRLNVKGYLFIQLVMIVIYLLIVEVLWNELPGVVATHFDVYGNPDSFMNKFSGAIIAPVAGLAIVPIITALISKEPMLIRFPVYGKGQRLLLTFLTLLQAFIFTIMVAVLLYNVKVISFGTFPLLVFGFVVFLFGWVYWMWKRYSIPI